MKALLVNVEFSTGKRPAVILNGSGKIKENLWCGNKWQNLDTGKEIRAVKDGNVTLYENVEGITILQTEAEIRAALMKHCPDEEVHMISNEGIMNANIVSSNIDFSELSQTASREEELAFLYDKGVRGIDRKTISPQDPSEVFPT